MGQFFKFLFASCLGVILAIGAIFGIGALILTSIAAKSEQPKSVKPNTVLRLTLEDPIPDLTNNVNVSPFETGFEETNILGLQDMVDALERAKEDDNIKGVFIEPSLMFSAGFTSAKELRDALVDFKSEGKFIYAHAGFYTQGLYYLSSVADKIYANPMGYFDVRGFSASSSFYQDMFERLGMKVEVFYAGKYKSATEPYRRKDYSPESKEQTRALLNEIYDIFLTDIAASRGLDKASLKQTVDQLMADSPENALATNLIDGVSYKETVINEIKERVGLEESDKLPMISLKDYNKSNPASSNYKAKDRIAVVYAEGVIYDGKTTNGNVGDAKYVKDINKLAEDDRVKAIVLRVNSPGGSALASENIWNALGNAKTADKPIIVSMGNYAASGGYYIACLGDSIFAERSTITGSIGVFRTIPVLGGGLKKTLGIDHDSIMTGPFAMPLNITFEMSEAEKRKMQQNTEQSYAFFLNRVAEGRGMSVEDVHEIAQGRVWTGAKAKEIGLVDKLGGLEEAIASAANMADLEDYRTVVYPKVKDPLQQLLEELMSDGGFASMRTKSVLAKEFPDLAPHYEMLKQMQNAKGPQARMSIHIPFN